MSNMKIKISDRFMNSLSPNLIRNWCEALLSLPGVEYVNENSQEHADIGIDTRDNVDLSVFVDSSDPHSLVNIYDVDSLVYEELLPLLTVPYIKPSIAFANNSSFDIEEINKWGVYAPMIAISPAERVIKPQLDKTIFIPLYHSIPESIFYNGKYDREFDVFFAGSMNLQWYPMRSLFHNELIKHDDIIYKYLLVSGDDAEMEARRNNNLLKDKQCAFDKQLQDCANDLKNSKICLFDDSIFKYPLKKYIECMATGCLVMAPMPIDSEYLGFQDGVNMVVVDENNFMDKVYYYLEHEEERKQIINNAYNLYLNRYTSKMSAFIFLNKLKKLL
jgi:hypothetical protein